MLAYGMTVSSKSKSYQDQAIPRRLLEGYLEEAARAVAKRQLALGARIRDAREEKRWKQKHLAAAVHVEPTTVSRWENGHTAPDLDMLESIAEALGKPMGSFVEEAKKPPEDGLDDRLASLEEGQLRLEALLAELSVAVKGLAGELEGRERRRKPA